MALARSLPRSGIDAWIPHLEMATEHRRYWLLGAILALTLVLRLSVWIIVGAVPESDSLAYFKMADGLANAQWPTDHNGLHAFYSIGYPLTLAPFFSVFGSSVGTAIGANLLMSLASALLIWKITLNLRLPAYACLFAALLHALWLPGMWNSAMLARENLSTPLLLLLIWLSLRLLNEGPKFTLLLGAGVTFGAAILAGGSALPLIVAPAIAIAVKAKWRFWPTFRPLAVIVAGTATLLAPWLMATHAMTGQAILNSNSGFNIYLGNNPAATGTFVSIADTPAAADWEHLLATKGEAPANAEMSRRAVTYMEEHPAKTLALAGKKLLLFWQPNIPDAADVAAAPLVSKIRQFEVAQYLLLVIVGLAGFVSLRLPVAQRCILGLPLLCFWALHGLVYIIIRYRDPIMPIMMVMAAVALTQALTEKDSISNEV